jgi:ribosome-binding ATPase YchF (GTP1/OBG family)
MSLKCGIVGLPNVGKSTLFNALTKAGIAAENYPFCTIEPNVGVVELPDARLGQLAAIAKPERIVPAIVEFVDIAGLVAGASKGEGSATSFSPTCARPTRSSTSSAASKTRTWCTSPARSTRSPTSRSSRPSSASPTLATSRRRWRATVKVAKAGNDKEPSACLDVLQKCNAALDEAKAGALDRLQQGGAGGAEAALPHHRQAGDVSWRTSPRTASRRNPHLDRLRESRPRQHAPVVVISAKTEAELADMSDEDRQLFLAEMGQTESGPGATDPRRLRAARAADLLHRRAEGGSRLDDPRRRHGAAGGRRASTPTSSAASSAPRRSPSPTTSPATASTGAKEAGKMRSEGKEYVVKDGDVLNFLFNV